MRQMIQIVFFILAGVHMTVAKEVKVGETSVNLPPPAGFCELDEQKSADARLLESVGDLARGGGNELFAMDADCEQLSDWRTGKRRLLDDFAQYQTSASMIDKLQPAAAEDAIKPVCATLRDAGREIALGGAAGYPIEDRGIGTKDQTQRIGLYRRSGGGPDRLLCGFVAKTIDPVRHRKDSGRSFCDHGRQAQNDFLLPLFAICECRHSYGNGRLT
jgi:hypothetical protein